MHKRITLWIVCILMSVLWLGTAQAQDAEESVARAVMITPKDGHADKLVEAITEYHHWVAQFEGHMKYRWYAIASGPNTGKFLARTGNHKWADFDADYDWDEEAGKNFQENVAPHIANMTVQYTSSMSKFDNPPENSEGYTHFAVTDWYVKNGQYAAFSAGLERIVKTLKEGGFENHWSFHSVDSGGHGGQIRIVGWNKGWSDFTEEDPSFFDLMSAELGSTEAFNEFMADWGSTFKSGQNAMYIYMPKASDYGDD